MNVNRFGKVKFNWTIVCQFLWVQVKIEEEMHFHIYARLEILLVNVYDHTTGGVNDPYGVKVIS